MFKEADTEQICQSYATDQEAISQLTQSLSNIVQSIISHKLWLKYHEYLDLVCSIAYFSATSLTGSQTLGEELTSIVSVHNNKLPSLIRRCLEVLLHVVISYTPTSLLTIDNVRRKLDGRLFEVIRSLLKVLGYAAPLLKHVHLLFFYIQGRYRHLSKRFLSLIYILVRSSPQPLTPYYKLLRFSSAIEFIFKLYHSITLREQETDNDDNIIDIAGCSQCPLCLDTIKNTTATLCGHSFCWHCILNWTQIKSFCPTCRSKVLPKTLIRIQN